MSMQAASSAPNSLTDRTDSLSTFRGAPKSTTVGQCQTDTKKPKSRCSLSKMPYHLDPSDSQSRQTQHTLHHLTSMKALNVTTFKACLYREVILPLRNLLPEEAPAICIRRSGKQILEQRTRCNSLVNRSE